MTGYAIYRCVWAMIKKTGIYIMKICWQHSHLSVVHTGSAQYSYIRLHNVYYLWPGSLIWLYFPLIEHWIRFPVFLINSFSSNNILNSRWALIPLYFGTWAWVSTLTVKCAPLCQGGGPKQSFSLGTFSPLCFEIEWG